MTIAPRPIVVGTRGSGLALRQTEGVVARLRKMHPGVEFTLKILRTSGDIRQDVPIPTLGQGAFTKVIEDALLKGEIDVAVHSLKDLPTKITAGLVVAATPKRADARDVLVNRWGLPFSKLPPSARIGTGSPRRQAQARALRPDIEVLPIRGNVDTRLRKAVGEDYDGAVLAAAGLERLGELSHVAEFLDPTKWLPAPGQGALAVQARSNDAPVLNLLAGLEHAPTRAAVTAERAVLEALGSGCQLALGAYGRVRGRSLDLIAVLGAPDGSTLLRASAHGATRNAGDTALEVHRALVAQGAEALL